ncbi:MAG TPA: quercetin 2,3-dioxygenase [Thermoleophilaceae bacterium]|nr:quercetin 2,3-dioxygenase [Thermoleophilaceae bacterium]
MNSTTSKYPTYAFFGALTTFKATSESTGGKLMLIEHVAARGVGSPLHVHHREDEWFYVLEGELTVWRDGDVVQAGPGDFVYGPRDVPHTFIVSSEEARFLLATTPADFEGFVRALVQPVETLEDPAPAGPPDMGPIMTAAAEYGLEILGPPGIPA